MPRIAPVAKTVSPRPTPAHIALPALLAPAPMPVPARTALPILMEASQLVALQFLIRQRFGGGLGRFPDPHRYRGLLLVLHG